MNFVADGALSEVVPALAAAVPLLNMIVPALIPAFADGIRGIFSWISGGRGAQPQNVDEQIKLMQAETERLRAVSELDKPVGDISRWVANLRASFRYIAAGLVLISGMALVGLTVLDPGAEEFTQWYLNYIVAPVWSFIFGERMLAHVRNGGKKR